MFQQTFIYLVIFVAHSCVSGTFAIRPEDDYEKVFTYQTLFCSEEPLRTRRMLKELDDIKMAIEGIQLSQGGPANETKESYMFDIRYDTLPQRCEKRGTPRNCAQATACTGHSGYYLIQVSEFGNETFLVECDARSEDGDWTVIQRRHDGSVDFYRSWSEYKDGFGDVNGEFFIGLEKLYALTNFDGPQELLILMENATNSFRAHAKYDSFSIGNESQQYVLKSLGRFSGNAHDALTHVHMGCKFSTKDQDNDNYKEGSCAQTHLGGWWYNKCHQSNLNGHFGDLNYAKGINWIGVTDYYSSLKYVKMMVRRRRHN